MARCPVCRNDTRPSHKRSLDSDIDVCQFFVRFVNPAVVHAGSTFICKRPCYCKLERGVKIVKSLQTLIRELHGSLHCRPVESHVDSSTQTDNDLSHSVPGSVISESEDTIADSQNILTSPIRPQQQPNSVCAPLRLQLRKCKRHIYTSTQHKRLRVEEPVMNIGSPHALTITAQSYSSSPVTKQSAHNPEQSTPKRQRTTVFPSPQSVLKVFG